MNPELKNLIDSFDSLDPKGQIRLLRALEELDAIEAYDQVRHWFLKTKDEKVKDEALKTLKSFDRKLQKVERQEARYSAKIARPIDNIDPFKSPYGSGRMQ
ncbi:TPA: hypothetical protein DCX15_00340 [bacterium]|nr:hypothetical protein [bacterium]